MKDKPCVWTENEDGYWETKCGEEFILETGTPKENEMKFCCFCGKKLKQVVYKE